MKKLCFYLFHVILLIFLTTSFALQIDDRGQMNQTDVTEMIDVHQDADMVRALKKAADLHVPVTIMAMRHSQGGQTLAPRAIVLNMLTFNKILQIDQAKQTISVQAGITWGEIQKAINPFGLSVSAMQSPNIFSVGGSMSANAHGDDFRHGAVGNSVLGFHLLLANGEKIWVSRTSHPELWRTTIGGYGLIGVITDVTLKLTENHLLVSHYQKTDVTTLPTLFRTQILNKPNTVLFYAHVNIVPGKNFLKELYVITYTDTHSLPNKIIPLIDPDQWDAILTPVFNLSRKNNFGKRTRWQIEQRVFKKYYDEKMVTRNNAMEKAVHFASNYHQKDNADWLQEYFIPIHLLPDFMTVLRAVMNDNQVNLLNVTIRFVPKETDFLLSYAESDVFSVVLYFNQDLSENALLKTRAWTQKLIASALKLGGKYYLTYQNFATLADFQKAYPAYRVFNQIKTAVDPNHQFVNRFYEKYFDEAHKNGSRA